MDVRLVTTVRKRIRELSNNRLYMRKCTDYLMDGLRRYFDDNN